MDGPSFLYPTNAFDLDNAATLARAAELVYRDAGDLEAKLVEPWQLHHFHFFDIRGTQGFVAADAASVVVCFRGTEMDALEDWIADAGIKLVAGPLGGRVHAGFYEALSQVWSRIVQLVARVDPHGKKTVWLTGHSLGAALATLAAARWLDEGRPLGGLYTFGQPRTGDVEFARNFNFAFKASAFRFVNHNDVVTRIPPRSFGYSHLGTFKYFTGPGELVDSIGWWNQFLGTWKVVVDDVFDWIKDGVRDHSMKTYRQRIESQLQAANPPQLQSNLARFLDFARRRPHARIRPRRTQPAST